MRATLYDAVGLGMLVGSTFFFYRCVHSLAQKDYVAALIVLVIGFVMIRVGVEVGKLAILIRREQEPG